MIIISPYAQKLRSGKNNPKNYPYWKELIALLNEPVVQVAVTGEEPIAGICHFDLTLDQLKQEVARCKTWIGVDSFFQHFCWDLGKPGFVLWGQSDPNIFGHPENINILKDRSYLRSNQFLTWEQSEYRTDCWVSPEIVSEQINNFINNLPSSEQENEDGN